MLNKTPDERRCIWDLLTNISDQTFEVAHDGTIKRALFRGRGEVEAENGRYLDRNIRDLVNPEIAESCLEMIDAAIERRETGVLEYAAPAEAGPEAQYEIRVLPVIPEADHCLILLNDVTDRDEQSVHEDRWKMALDAVGDGMWDADLVRGTVFFSDKWYQMTGYRPYDMPPESQAWASKVHPDDLVTAQAAMNAYLKGRSKEYSAEVRYMQKNGEYRWMLSRGIVAARDAAGKATRMIGTHSDIHDRKVVEEDVRLSNEKFSSAFNNSAHGMTLIDPDGNWMEVNEGFCRITGYSREELLKLNFRQLTHPDDLPTDIRLRQVLKEGRIPKFDLEKRFMTKSEGDKWCLVTVSMVRNADSSPKFFLTQVVDIHDRKLAAEELRLTMQKFSNAFQYSPNGMTLTGLDGALMDVNDSFCQITGYEKSDLLSMCCQDITYHEDKAQDFVMRQALEAREVEKFDFEKRYVTPDRGLVWTLVNVSMVWNNDGSPKHFITQVIDITERKRLMDEIHRKNKELEEAHASLEKKIRQLEEMNHIIGHNLRGPAGNLKMLIGAMKGHENMPTDDNPAGLHEVLGRPEILDMMEKSSRSQMGTLDTLMELTQIGLNKNIPFEDIDVEEAAQDVMHQLQAMVAQKRARISMDLEVKTLRYPRVYLESILYNLISNALKYCRADGTPEIVISTAGQQDKACLRVKDNGLGIDLDRYGNKIFKLNQVFHKGQDSKGVGLFITKAQIEALGGSIEVASQPNVGTEFTVHI